MTIMVSDISRLVIIPLRRLKLYRALNTFITFRELEGLPPLNLPAYPYRIYTPFE